jgi:small subunit ribosomal protein S3Ae
MVEASSSKAKIKKRWFSVLSPEIFGKKEIVDILAVSADSAIKKLVDVTGQMLTGLPRDVSKKYQLQVTEAVGEKLRTEPKSFYLVDSFIQRTVKKFKERFIYVIKCTTKDNKTVKIKLLFLNVKKMHHSERGAVLSKTKDFLQKEVKNIEASKLFDPNVMDKLTGDLKKALTEAYIVDKILLTKLKIL